MHLTYLAVLTLATAWGGFFALHIAHARLWQLCGACSDVPFKNMLADAASSVRVSAGGLNFSFSHLLSAGCPQGVPSLCQVLSSQHLASHLLHALRGEAAR